MKKAFKLLRIGIVLFIICLPVITQAQPPGDDDVEDVPLDGGIGILLATGIAYGAKKALEKKKKTVSLFEIR